MRQFPSNGNTDVETEPFCDRGRILDSEILDPVSPGHGQIGSLQTVEDVLDIRQKSTVGDGVHGVEAVEMDAVVEAFHDVRDDRKSPDYYVAEPERNCRFIQRARELGIKASEHVINKALFNARKSNRLKGLDSERTILNEEFLKPLLDRLWRPSPDDLLFSYANISQRKLVRPVEERLLREKRPLFNIPPAASRAICKR